MTKVRGKESSRIVFGRDWGQTNARSCFDSDHSCIVQPEILEHELDFIFSRLGFDGMGRVESPVLMTETVMHPRQSREYANELLFECYQVPAVSFGIDGLFSYYFNNVDNSSDGGVVINCGHHATHLIPIYNQQWYPEHTRRLSVGGRHAADAMLKMLQLKYSNFPMKLSLQHAQSLAYHKTAVARDYLEELGKFEGTDYYENIIQFPYPQQSSASAEEQQMIEAASERRREQQRERLREMAAKKRRDNLESKQRQLGEYRQVLRSGQDAKELKHLIRAFGFKSLQEMEKAIRELEKTIEKLEAKIKGIELPKEEKQAPDFSLVDVPDSELDEEQLKEKRKQRMLKAGWDSRERLRLEKEQQRLDKVRYNY